MECETIPRQRTHTNTFVCRIHFEFESHWSDARKSDAASCRIFRRRIAFYKYFIPRRLNKKWNHKSQSTEQTERNEKRARKKNFGFKKGFLSWNWNKLSVAFDWLLFSLVFIFILFFFVFVFEIRRFLGTKLIPAIWDFQWIESTNKCEYFEHSSLGIDAERAEK